MCGGRRLSTAEAARRLGVNRAHVSWLVAQGYLTAEKVGGRLLISESSVESHAAERARWVSIHTVSQMLGCSRKQVEHLLADRRLVGRPKWGTRPGVELASVQAQIEPWRAEAVRREREAAERARAQEEARAAALPPDDGHLYISMREAAVILEVTKSWVVQLVERDSLPHVRRGRRVWLRRDHVEMTAAARVARQTRRP